MRGGRRMSQSRGSTALKEIARSTSGPYGAAGRDMPLACRSQLGLAMRSLPKPPAPSPFAMQHDLADACEEDCGIWLSGGSGRIAAPIAPTEMLRGLTSHSRVANYRKCAMQSLRNRSDAALRGGLG